MLMRRTQTAIDLSLSARRAWIEIDFHNLNLDWILVALRKESVDRNSGFGRQDNTCQQSLSARRAWIEMPTKSQNLPKRYGRSPQGERG